MKIINLELIVSSFVAGSLLTSLIFILIWLHGSPWEIQFYKAKTTLKPGRSGAKKLENLMILLNKIVFWLKDDNTLLMPDIRDRLWQQAIYLNVQIQFYTANYCQNIQQQRAALKQLCWAIKQLKRGKAKVTAAIIEDPSTVEEVRRFATELLAEFESKASVKTEHARKKMGPDSKSDETQNHATTIQINNMLNNQIDEEVVNKIGDDSTVGTNLQAEDGICIQGDVAGQDKIVHNNVTDIDPPTVTNELTQPPQKTKRKSKRA